PSLRHLFSGRLFGFIADVLRCARADATWPFRRLLRSLRLCLSALRANRSLERILHRVAHRFRSTDRRRRNLRVLQGEDASDILDGHRAVRIAQLNSEERKFTAHRSGLHGSPPLVVVVVCCYRISELMTLVSENLTQNFTNVDSAYFSLDGFRRLSSMPCHP